MVETSEKEEEREIAKRVLMAMGYEPTDGNFRLWGLILDWRATAKLIEHPIRTALCHILDGDGNIVMDSGRPVVVARDVEAGTDDEAAETLVKESLRFVRWWPANNSTSPRRIGERKMICSDKARQ